MLGFRHFLHPRLLFLLTGFYLAPSVLPSVLPDVATGGQPGARADLLGMSASAGQVPADAIVNPLELTGPDPLLPQLVVDRPLSPQEQRVLATALDQLQAQGAAKFTQGDLPGAFALWHRELRLRRYLGAEAEVAALSRVGEVAWRQSQTTEVRLITERLQAIHQELERPSSPNVGVNYGLLLEIAQAYQKMRAQAPAIALYTQLLARAREEKNITQQKNILIALAQLHSAWFDYAQAAATYQELLEIAKAQGDRQGEIDYLQALARVYQQNQNPQQAIEIQQQLVQIYRQKQDFLKIPPLKLAMGDAYFQIQRPELAAATYQEAFSVARGVQQYGYATEALERLASLYQSLDRPEDMIVVYQLQLDVQRQAYDALGMMNTYDRLGQLYRERGNNPEAAIAFRQGLELAQQLNYKVDYFIDQIRGVSP